MPETETRVYQNAPAALGNSAWERMVKLSGEFVGTSLLVFVIGCTMLTHFPTNRAGLLPATSIAMTLCVMIYAIGPLTGGHFNPAVSFALWLKGAVDAETWVLYTLTQIVAGLVGAGCFVMVFDGKTIALEPGKVYEYQFDINQALLVEAVYTTMLCLVVLCVASTKNNAGNEFFGVAIGLVIVAGGYSVGGISGGAFNPAVAFGLDITHKMKLNMDNVETGESHQPENCVKYAGIHLLSGLLAAAIHRLIYPLEYAECGPQGRPKHVRPSADANAGEKLVCWYLRTPILHRMFGEFFGVYFVVCTVGFAMSTKAANGAWAIGAAVTCMFYSMRNCSGAHLNPAVTWAVLLSHPRPQVPRFMGSMAGLYITAQLIGAQLAGLTYAGLFKWQRTFALEPAGDHTMKQVAILEIVYTCVMVLVFMMLTQVKTGAGSKAFHGFILGGVMMMGGTSAGQTSGYAFNPAIALGVDFASAAGQYSHAFRCFGTYAGFEITGAMVAFALFRLLAHGEYALPAKPGGEKEALLEDYGPPEDGADAAPADAAPADAAPVHEPAPADAAPARERTGPLLAQHSDEFTRSWSRNKMLIVRRNKTGQEGAPGTGLLALSDGPAPKRAARVKREPDTESEPEVVTPLPKAARRGGATAEKQPRPRPGTTPHAPATTQHAPAKVAPAPGEVAPAPGPVAPAPAVAVKLLEKLESPAQAADLACFLAARDPEGLKLGPERPLLHWLCVLDRQYPGTSEVLPAVRCLGDAQLQRWARHFLDACRTPVDLEDDAGRTGLSHAACLDAPGLVTLLCTRLRGHDPAFAENEDNCGRTALFHAAAHGRVDACRVLLAFGFDPQRPDAQGDTALAYAAKHGFAECARLLASPPDAPLPGGPAKVDDVAQRPELPAPPALTCFAESGSPSCTATVSTEQSAIGDSPLRKRRCQDIRVFFQSS